MAKTKTIPNEAIISALLQHGTITAAAKALNVSQRTIYDRMKEPDFEADYSAARADILLSAVSGFNKKLSSAIDEVEKIMTDDAVNPATRLQAAQTIITNAGKFTQQLNEHAATRAREHNKLDMGGIFL